MQSVTTTTTATATTVPEASATTTQAPARRRHLTFHNSSSPSGEIKRNINGLVVGRTHVTITITSEDKTVARKYEVSIVRTARPCDTQLSVLKMQAAIEDNGIYWFTNIAPVYSIVPRFDAPVYDGYTTNVPYYVGRVDVFASTVRRNGDVAVTVGVLPPGADPGNTSVPLLNATTTDKSTTDPVFRSVPLFHGETFLVARTHAQDNFTIVQYTVKVNRMLPPPPPSPPPPSPPPPPPPPPPPSPPPPAFTTMVVKGPPRAHNTTESFFEFYTPLCEEWTCRHECKVDVALWKNCSEVGGATESMSLSLNPGNHTLLVRARGHPSETTISPAVTEYRWLIDVSNPTVSIRQTMPYEGGLTYSNARGSRPFTEVRLVLEFSQPVVGMNVSRVTITGGEMLTYSEVAKGTMFNIGVSPGANSRGELICTTSLNLIGVADASGNAPVLGEQRWTFNSTTYPIAAFNEYMPAKTAVSGVSLSLARDLISPRVALARVPQAYYGIAYAPNPVYFELAFSETIRAVVKKQVQVSGGELQSVMMPNTTHVTLVVNPTIPKGAGARSQCDTDIARRAVSFMDPGFNTDVEGTISRDFGDTPNLRPRFVDIIPSNGNLPCVSIVVTNVRDAAGNALVPPEVGMLVRYDPEVKEKRELKIWHIVLIVLASAAGAMACFLAVLARRRSTSLRSWELAIAPPVKVFALDPADLKERETREIILKAEV